MRSKPDPLPGRDAELVGVPGSAITVELLGLGEEFFRHASPAVLTELRQFLTAHGCHPNTGLGWFLDSLGFATFRASS